MYGWLITSKNKDFNKVLMDSIKDKQNAKFTVIEVLSENPVQIRFLLKKKFLTKYFNDGVLELHLKKIYAGYVVGIDFDCWII